MEGLLTTKWVLHGRGHTVEDTPPEAYLHQDVTRPSPLIEEGSSEEDDEDLCCSDEESLDSIAENTPGGDSQGQREHSD